MPKKDYNEIVEFALKLTLLSCNLPFKKAHYLGII